MSRDLLLEVGCEEIPAKPLDDALAGMRHAAVVLLDSLRLRHGDVWVSGTPRRLVLTVKDVADAQDALRERRRGPAVTAAFGEDGAPTRAAQGFAGSQGVEVDDLVVEEGEQGSYVYAVREEAGKTAEQVLPKALEQLVLGMLFGKAMRWGDGSLKFARPIRWLLALFGDEVLPVELDGVTSGRVTYGHRFLAPGPFEVSSAADYVAVVRERGLVTLDRDERAGFIREELGRVAVEKGWKAILDDPPFSEVVNLVEAPHVVLGHFGQEHAKLPREVLATAMESHQRYFPVEDGAGRLAPGFLVVHNGDPAASQTIVRGHERVIQARLADAEFFFAEDRKRALADRVDDLRRLVFQERLGTVYEKGQRVQGIVHFLAKALCGDDPVCAQAAERGALLAKTDLVTDMVVEFPTLQGVMGREYARLDGEPDAVADAIFEHYLPRFQGDALPVTPAGQLVSIADKIDTIVGCFSVGLIPSGSEDPYALRRQGLGIVRIAVERRLPLKLRELIEAATAHYGRILHNVDLDGVPSSVSDFMADRLRSYCLATGLRYDRVDAVLAGGLDDFLSAYERVKAITDFLATPGADDLMTGFTRAANLGQPDLGAAPDPSFMSPPEVALLEAVRAAHRDSQAALAAGDYPAALAALAELRAPVDQFFVDILVMDPDQRLRENRLRLLNRLVSVFTELADFRVIVTGPADQA